MDVVEVSQSVLDRFKKVGTPTVFTILMNMGYESVFMEGVFPMNNGRALAARARTLRFLPSRPDLRKAVSRGEDSPEYEAMALCGPGDVLVVDTGAMRYASIGGDIKFMQLQMQGADGIITDGAVRDVAGLTSYGLVVYARGRTPKAGPVDILPYEGNVAIQCGGALVVPGDVIVGDDSGAVVVPAQVAEEVVEKAEEYEEIELFIKDRVRKERCAPGRYYVPNEETWRLYREYKKDNPGQDSDISG
jgi:regulator of RNase E activity RraA